MKTCALLFLAIIANCRGAIVASFDPAAGQPGSLAIARDDSRIIGWATGVNELHRGLQAVDDPDLGGVTWGDAEFALGPADAQIDSFPVVSLGDAGWIDLAFANPITNGAGADFAVFENGITDTFLELAFVEVSSDGVEYVRFPAISLTPTNAQIDGFGALEATNLYNLAGKYRRGFGTPFDLDDLVSMAPSLDVSRITHVRVRDVVGAIDPRFATFDAAAPLAHIVNDPWPTPYETGGFDLDAIAVLHQIPEPRALLLALCGIAALSAKRGNRSMPLPRTARDTCARSGMTIIELMTVLTVLGVVVTVIFAALQHVNERCEAAHCSANLRELASANITYAAEHDGQYVAAQEPKNLVRWHGERGGLETKFDGRKGPLAPYLGGDGAIKLCPSLRNVLQSESFEYGCGGYGYNALYVGGTPVSRWVPARIGQIGRASRTVMFTDTAFPRKNGLQEYAFSEPWCWVDVLGRLRGKLSPSVHFRHANTANVAWCDGHVSAESPSELGDGNQYGGDARKWNIGWFGPSTDNGYWKP
ncbi:MAG TPA: H-X9-DG-CTERM domain-containing protein [Chthoniobacteraceae bacterium]|nr:H-X9-DG-CTERM domain-containing protein [Chthoniobacteraceae bacterium]